MEQIIFATKPKMLLNTYIVMKAVSKDSIDSRYLKIFFDPLKKNYGYERQLLFFQDVSSSELSTFLVVGTYDFSLANFIFVAGLFKRLI